MENEDYKGKIVFFLYPPNIIEEELIEKIVKEEYEAYILKDHKIAIELLKEYSESILYINIDSVLSESQWEKYINELKNNPLTKDVHIGVLTYKEDKNLAKKFLIDLGIECGYIVLKQGTLNAKKIIFKVLEYNEAKGRRKFLRVMCNNKSIASFNIKIGEEIISGVINDLSIIGIAGELDKNNIQLKEGDILKDIQLRLLGSVVSVYGKIKMIRKLDNDKKLYIIIFENLPQISNDKIHHFIYQIHQENMDKKIKQINIS